MNNNSPEDITPVVTDYFNTGAAAGAAFDTRPGSQGFAEPVQYVPQAIQPPPEIPSSPTTYFNTGRAAAASFEAPQGSPGAAAGAPKAVPQGSQGSQANRPGTFIEDPLGHLGDFLADITSAGTLGLLPDAKGEHPGPLGYIVTKLFGHDPYAADEWEGAMAPTRARRPYEPNPATPGLDGKIPGSGADIAQRIKSRIGAPTYGPNNPPVTPNLVAGGTATPEEIAAGLMRGVQVSSDDGMMAGLAANLGKQLGTRKASGTRKVSSDDDGGSGGSTDVDTGSNKILETAKKFAGNDEQTHTKTLAEFFKKAAGININPAKTAWCAAFANSVLGANGVKGTGSLMAKSFLNWGTETKNPTKGDVVVLARGNQPNSPFGHVGFVVKRENGKVWVLGGNQSDAVNVKVFDEARVLGYRHPPTKTASVE